MALQFCMKLTLPTQKLAITLLLPISSLAKLFMPTYIPLCFRRLSPQYLGVVCLLFGQFKTRATQLQEAIGQIVLS